MKKKIIVLLMTMTMAASVLAGCGTDSSSVADNKKTETSAKSDSANETEDLKEDVDATENNTDASKEEDSQEVNPFLGPDGLMFASEEDVVINIAGVDVPMTSTRDELIALIEENNWEIKYRFTDSDMIEGFITPDGDVYAEVLKEISFDEPVFLTKNGRGRYAIVDIEEYEKTKAIIKLMEKLAEGEKSAKENGWLSIDEVKDALGV